MVWGVESLTPPPPPRQSVDSGGAGSLRADVLKVLSEYCCLFDSSIIINLAASTNLIDMQKKIKTEMLTTELFIARTEVALKTRISTWLEMVHQLVSCYWNSVLETGWFIKVFI